MKWLQGVSGICDRDEKVGLLLNEELKYWLGGADNSITLTPVEVK